MAGASGTQKATILSFTSRSDGISTSRTAPGPQSPIGSTDTQTTETTNYEISNTTTTTVKEAGEVKKLAVAVAVDGKYTPPASGDGEPTYTPVSEEDRAKIESLVKAAVGFDAERGDVVQVTALRFNRDIAAAPDIVRLARPTVGRSLAARARA